MSAFLLALALAAGQQAPVPKDTVPYFVSPAMTRAGNLPNATDTFSAIVKCNGLPPSTYMVVVLVQSATDLTGTNCYVAQNIVVGKDGSLTARAIADSAEDFPLDGAGIYYATPHLIDQCNCDEYWGTRIQVRTQRLAPVGK